MKCIDCYNEGCLQRAYTADAECVFEQLETQEFDWQSFRNQAAKDILCAIIQSGYYGEDRIEHQSELAVRYADALVLKLKEKEDK